MKKNKKMIFILAVCFVAVAAIAAFIFIQIKDQTYFHSPPYAPQPGQETAALVGYYPRSGNTGAMAR